MDIAGVAVHVVGHKSQSQVVGGDLRADRSEFVVAGLYPKMGDISSHLILATEFIASKLEFQLAGAETAVW